MADQATAADDDQALKKRLLTRVAIAGAVIVALLGGLALIDTLYVERPKQAADRAEDKPVTGSSPTASSPSSKTEAEKNGAPPVATQSDAGIIRTGETAAPEEEKTAKAVSAPPVAEHTAAPPSPPDIQTERRPTRPAEARIAAIRPAEPIAVPRTEPETAALASVPRNANPRAAAGPIAEPTAASPWSTTVRHAPASRPLSRLAETSSQYLLQLGVFSNLANAEELRARLELAGVPAHLEARVQVGPFATREEALRAQEKIRALGLEPGLVVAVRK